jgi:hypothetical protein
MIVSLIAIGIGTLLAIGSFVILAVKLGHPYHRRYAVLAVLMSMACLCAALAWNRAQISPYIINAQQGWQYAWPYLVGMALCLITGTIILGLIPKKTSGLKTLSKKKQKAYIREDAAALVAAQTHLQSIIDACINIAQANTPTQHISAPDRTALKELWYEFIIHFVELDLIKDRYHECIYISRTKQKKLHEQSFLLAYGAFVTQYHALATLHNTIGNIEPIIALLDDETSLYTEVTTRLIEAQSLLILNAGRGYINTISSQVLPKVHERITTQLKAIDTLVKPTTVAKKQLTYLEHHSLSAWLPLQTNAAIGISKLRASRRPYFLTISQLQQIQKKLKPGDILFERRSWHATNIGIPGFWPHLALYIGDHRALDEYFRDLPELQGTPASAILKQEFPKAWEAHKTKDKQGAPMRVIESRQGGVQWYSFEESAQADALAIIRPALPKQAIWQAIKRAYTHYGKEYDYNFDFRTDGTLVCSELIYKSYEGFLPFEPTLQNGRLMLSPNDVAQGFALAYTQGTPCGELIAFFDQNEHDKRAEEKDWDAFVASTTRTKWDILTQLKSW